MIALMCYMYVQSPISPFIVCVEHAVRTTWHLFISLTVCVVLTISRQCIVQSVRFSSNPKMRIVIVNKKLKLYIYRNKFIYIYAYIYTFKQSFQKWRNVLFFPILCLNVFIISMKKCFVWLYIYIYTSEN